MIKDRAEVSGGSRPATQSGARPEAEDGQMAGNLHCQPPGASAPGPSGLPTRKGAFEPRQERAETEFQPRNAESPLPCSLGFQKLCGCGEKIQQFNKFSKILWSVLSLLLLFLYHLFEQEFQAAYKWGHKREKQ